MIAVFVTFDADDLDDRGSSSPRSSSWSTTPSRAADVVSRARVLWC
jgi:hypothetical protein